MRIVILTRNIYPLLSPRAFRSTELAKEFARLGHDVTIYAVLGDYDYRNFSNRTGIRVKPIKMKFSTKNSDGKVRYNFFDKIAYHTLGNIIEYPDIEFCWKIPRIIREESKSGEIDMLITIAYPHPIHWGAAIAKSTMGEGFPKLWVSDCGDPYMGNTVGDKKPFYFKWIEQFWGNKTDFVTVPLESAKGAYYQNVQSKLRVIPQGFNMDNIELKTYIRKSVPKFAYAGSIYPGLRDPASFLEYLSTLDKDFIFTVYTNDLEYYRPFKDKLGDKLKLNSYIPRDELLKELSTQDFLINLTNPNNAQSPSKLIDYYLSKRPILDISTPFKETDDFLEALMFKFEKWHKPMDISQYDIKNVALSFLSLMKE